MTSDFQARQPPAPKTAAAIAGRVVSVAVGIACLALAIWMIGLLLRGCSDAALDFGQPRVERETQERLAQSSDPIWSTLGTTEIGEDQQRGVFTARFPADVQALAGKTVSVDGFMQPLESNVETHHFLLSKRTPVCPFCPPGQPNEVIEVYSTPVVVPTTAEITVTGRFNIQAKGGLFFQLYDADVS
jgi:hypothetical protein